MLSHIPQYFPHLTPRQLEQFEILMSRYPEWNDKINVISRKDIENLEVNHLLHSLAPAKFLTPVEGTRILDFGTGGGLPGLPLAIVWPQVQFLLADRTGKKIRVATEIAEASGIENVSFFYGDVADCKEKFDFVVSRAVMPQKDLLKICRKNILPENKNAIPNGLITLKGGDLTDEIKDIKGFSETIDISDYFPLPFFDTKKILFTSL